MKNKKSILMLILTISFLLFTILFFIYAFYQRNIIADKYDMAVEILNEGNYSEAIRIFSTMQDYKDSNDLKQEAEKGIIYLEANELFDKANYLGAIEKFEQIEGFKDSNNRLLNAKYCLGLKYYENDEFEFAKKIFLELGDYLDSKFYLAQIDIKNINKSKELIYEKAILQFGEQNYEKALELFETIIDYKDAKEKIEECKLRISRKNPNNAIAGGIRCSMAITDKGTILAVGANPEGQCDVSNWENIVSIDTYGCFTIGLDSSGKVVLAGNYDGKDVEVQSWNEIIDVAAGERFVVGLMKDGTVIADGHNGDGQIEVDNWEKVVAIDAGWSFTVGLTEEKKLLFAGVDNGQKEQFDKVQDEWKDVVNIAASGGGNTSNIRGKGHTVGLKSDGTVVAIGDNSFGQCNVSNWSDIVKVVAGDWYTVGLKKDGKIVITGSNTPNNRYIEMEIIEKCINVVDIAAGFGHTLCLNTNGTVTAFGFDDDNKVSGTAEWKNLKLPYNK